MRRLTQETKDYIRKRCFEGMESPSNKETGGELLALWVISLVECSEDHPDWFRYGDRETGEAWNDNFIQFPRLICEISATQNNLDLEELAESMDLNLKELNELFDRAHALWEDIKERSRG